MEKNITISDFNNICRTCLSKHDLQTISSFVNYVLTKHTQFKFDSTANLPKQICSKCVEKLNDAYTFLNNCDLVNNALIECSVNSKRSAGLPSENIDVKIEVKEEPLDFNNDELIIKNEVEENDIHGGETSSSCQSKIIKLDAQAQLQSDLVKCYICSKDFHKTTIDNHLKTHDLAERVDVYSGKVFACNLCTKSFCSGKYLKEHEGTHRDKAPICKEKFLRKHSTKVNVCGVCNHIFPSGPELDKHQSKHNSLIPCGICRTIIFSSALTSHLRIHGFKYTCTVCDDVFNSAIKLSEHKKVRSARCALLTAGICTECGKKYPDTNLVKHHIKLTHPINLSAMPVARFL